MGVQHVGQDQRPHQEHIKMCFDIFSDSRSPLMKQEASLHLYFDLFVVVIYPFIPPFPLYCILKVLSC